MRPIMPVVTIRGDSPDRIMARSGDIIGLSKSRVVWRFGFANGSDMAKLTGVSTDTFIIVVATFTGRILAMYDNPSESQRKRYLRILNKPL